MSTALERLIDDYQNYADGRVTLSDAARAEQAELLNAIRLLYDPCDHNGKRPEIEALLARFPVT